MRPCRIEQRGDVFRIKLAVGVDCHRVCESRRDRGCESASQRCGLPAVPRVCDDGQWRYALTRCMMGEKLGRAVVRAVIHHQDRQPQRLDAPEDVFKRLDVVVRRRNHHRTNGTILYRICVQ